MGAVPFSQDTHLGTDAEETEHPGMTHEHCHKLEHWQDDFPHSQLSMMFQQIKVCYQRQFSSVGMEKQWQTEDITISFQLHSLQLA